MCLTSMAFKRLTPVIRAKILEAHSNGVKPKEIEKKVSVHLSTVYRTIKHYVGKEIYASKAASGRPKITTPAERRIVVRSFLTNNEKNASRACGTVLDRKVSASTIRRILYDVGLHGRVKRKKPFLKREHIVLRLLWAKKMKFWDRRARARIIFSDESKFNIFWLGREGILLAPAQRGTSGCKYKKGDQAWRWVHHGMGMHHQ